MKRSQQANSIIELMVSLSVISIAIAGLGEVFWINSSFSSRIFNKVDNSAAVYHFMDMIGRDIRASRNIGDLTQAAPSLTFQTYTLSASPGSPAPPTLILQIPATAQNGFPYMLPAGTVYSGSPAQTAVDTIVYQVVPDPNNAGQWIVQRTVYTANSLYPTVVPTSWITPTQQRTSITTAETVLTGVTGPLSKTSGSISPFTCEDSANSGAPAGITPASGNLANISRIIINLETTKDGAIYNANSPQTSTVAIRQEFYMRNHLADIY